MGDEDHSGNGEQANHFMALLELDSGCSAEAYGRTLRSAIELLDLDLPLGYTVVPPPVADLPSHNHSIFVEVGLDTGDPSLAAHRLDEVVALIEGTPSSMSVVRRWSERRADREKAFSDWRRRAHAADLRRAVQSLLPGGCTT